MPNIQLTNRPRWLSGAFCEMPASRPMTHIWAAHPLKNRNTNISEKECA
jgi:hypothetical protein